jgi:hypothetical protein
MHYTILRYVVYHTFPRIARAFCDFFFLFYIFLYILVSREPKRAGEHRLVMRKLSRKVGIIYENRCRSFTVVFSAAVAEDVWGEEEEALNF